MNFKFQHVNDYHFIIPKTHQRSGNDFRALIDKHFPEDDQLIFCLMEKVTLSDINAIGATYMYSGYSRSEGGDVLDRYVKIVERVREKNGFNISEFLEWYRKNSYILIQENHIAAVPPSVEPTWELTPDLQEAVKDRSQYGTVTGTHLTDEMVQQYLHDYAQLLHNEFGFKNYPHYCIIVRPIAAIDGNTVIPLGNIYLHFATATARDTDFYLKLINEFLYVWFKKKGVKIIQEVQSRAIQEYEESREAAKDYVPKMPYREDGNKKGRYIVELLYTVYENGVWYAELENRLRTVRETLLPFLLGKKNILPDQGETAPFMDEYHGGKLGDGTAKLLHIPPEEFIKAVVQRHVALILILLFRYKPSEVHYFLIKEENGLGKETEGADAVKKFFYENLYLGNVSKREPKIVQQKIFRCISDREREYLDGCKREIEHRLDGLAENGRILFNQYNQLCHEYFRIEK